MHGWHGQALHVNLKTQQTRSEQVSPELLQSYLGGRGLGDRLMRETFTLDPFDADMPLIFAVGPLCGTDLPATDQLAIVSRSPLTGTIFSNSTGSRFATRLKQAGYDMLIITGKSDKPVTLQITPDSTVIEEATALWGTTTTETLSTLAAKGSSAVIGPAGEAQVLFASIQFHDGGTAARGGLGAVMGSKRLKAISVDGDIETAVAEPQRLANARDDILRLFNASPALFGELGFKEFGTAALVDLIARRRMAPTANFRETFFPGSFNYSGPALQKEYAPLKNGCHNCPIGCRVTASDGQPLPEYDTISQFGGLLNNDDLPTIIAANNTCTALGLDPVSAAASIAAWSELRGSFPEPEDIVPLLHDIAARNGDGEQIAHGARRLAEDSGRPEVAMTVKSLELPACDPRGAYGIALSYCTSTRGGCHQQAGVFAPEILRKPVATDRFSFAGKAKLVKIGENNNAVIESLVACRFAFFGASLEEYGEALAAATGIGHTLSELQQIGERIFLTERCYNQQNGFDRNDDTLPERFFTEAGSHGEEFDIPPLDRVRFYEERDRYYRLRGLDQFGQLNTTEFLGKQP